VAEELYKAQTLIKEGILRAFSIGFLIKDYDWKEVDGDFILVYKDIEILENSLVSVPANPNALFNIVKGFEDDLKQCDGIRCPSPKKDEGEKETMDKELMEKLAKLEAEKAAAEKAEKEALKKEITEAKELVKSFEEGIKTLTNTIETLKTELKETKEELEVVKNAKPKVEIVATAKEAIKKNIEEYKDLAFEAMLTKKKDWTATKKFASMPEGLKSITFDSDFTQFVHDEILEDVKANAPIFKYLMNKTGNALTDIFPFEGSVNASWGSLTLTDYDMTGKISFDYKKVLAGVKTSYDANDDAVISWLPKVRKDIVGAVADAVDAGVINGTGAANDFKGVLKYAVDAGYTSEIAGADNSLTAEAVRKAKILMKKYAVNTKALFLIVNSYKYLQLINDDAFISYEKAGPNMILFDGAVGTVAGAQVIINDAFDGTDTAADDAYSGLLFNADMFLAKAKPMLVEVDKDIESQDNIIVGSMRTSVIPALPLTGGNITSPICVAINNGL
jgi:HK97 family phage major capsid protein